MLSLSKHVTGQEKNYKMPRFWERVHFLSWTLLVLSLGYALGLYGNTLQDSQAPAPIEAVDLRSPTLPVVHIEEIREGKITGTVGTGARLLIGSDLIAAESDGSFTVPAGSFLTNIVAIKAPDGAAYVASKRGKNYYPLSSKNAESLKPENRIYFGSEEEAEAAGYKRGS